METRIFDSELKVLEVLWNEGDISAKRIAEILSKNVGWSRTTTYTVIKKCIDKNLLKRLEPNYICHALITQNEIRKSEAEMLIDKVFGGSKDMLIATLLSGDDLNDNEIAKIQEYIKSFK